jgi:signal transduction histidine kinase
VPEVDRPSWLTRPAGETWPRLLRVAAPLLGAAAAGSLLLPPHTHEAKANELALFYGFTGWWASGLLLSRRLTRKAWALLSVVTFGLLLPRLLGQAPPDIGPSYTPPWPAYPLPIRWVQLAVAAGVGLAGLLGARLLLTGAEHASSATLARQIRRRPVFLYAACLVAFGISAGSVRVVTAGALLLLIGCSAAWAVTAVLLRLVEIRLATVAVITVASIVGVAAGGLVIWSAFHHEPGGPTSPLSFALLLGLLCALIGLGAVGLAGVAAFASELIIRCATRLGGLVIRFAAFGLLIAAVVGGEPMELVWPIKIRPNVVPGEGVLFFNLQLAIIVVVAAALVRRFARDLRTARGDFQAIASGELPRSTVVVGREESSRLLERLAHFSAQLSKRPFLEQLNAELRARADQLRVATRQLNDTNTQRVEAERFAAIAGIVATASHELRNPIAQIAGNLPLIRSYVEATGRNLRNPEELGGDSARILAKMAQQLSASGNDVEESARRASLVLADLNAVSATPIRALEASDLRGVIERSVRLTPRSPDVRVQCDLEPVPALTARAGELEQVLANLLENAMAAVAPAGTVLVRLRATGSAVLLEVEDDGPGMAPDVLARATEPFFTTKLPSEGSGLGLAIVSSIVDSHDGTLRIVSGAGAGTRVAVTLPFKEAVKRTTFGEDEGGNGGRAVPD